MIMDAIECIDNSFDSIDSFKRQRWRSWLVTPIPMIGAQSPIEASKTIEGRKKLQDILSYYESLRRGDTIDVMPPSGWVKWRLGIDKVDNGETIYATEEAGMIAPQQLPHYSQERELLEGSKYVTTAWLKMKSCTCVRNVKALDIAAVSVRKQIGLTTKSIANSKSNNRKTSPPAMRENKISTGPI